MIDDGENGPMDQLSDDALPMESECKICHELFITNDCSNICNRCEREQIINDED